MKCEYINEYAASDTDFNSAGSRCVLRKNLILASLRIRASCGVLNHGEFQGHARVQV